MNDHRIKIITGYFGSGKTEFSVNFAIKLHNEGKKVAIADLDIINPYFRSREKTEMLENMGIEVISSSIGHQKSMGIDLPSISASVLKPIIDKSYYAVLDVGGDHSGARALKRYVNHLKEKGYEMLYVINKNRVFSGTKEEVIENISKIEAVSGLKVTGLVNNTHLLKETDVDTVMSGQILSREVSNELGIPILYTSAIKSVVDKLPKDVDGDILPINMYMREAWML
ncbi:nucleotide-binding protein [Anaeromicrobium sediminis]|uniref:ATP-binding protein n=1 Tax=Anaeromicrobium sediminis TaxID=1478221 RepID=A0A267MLA3_9FIRM|nr:ATP-binding protein [Anaeromicrobium sediminis]PAB60207.1 ATP-binding protein [Anaeromicrobium sediminis]